MSTVERTAETSIVDFSTIHPKHLEGSTIEVLFPDSVIQTRIKALAEEINRTYSGCSKLTVVCILKGGFLFLADLIRYVTVPVQIEFVRLASYGNNTKSSGSIRPVDLTLPKLEGEEVLVIEDIIDTGLTLSFFMDYLRSLHNTKSLRLAVLLDKPAARLQSVDVKVDFTGFQVGNQFLVGYGLDYAGYYRNLPYIGILHLEEAKAEGM